MNISRRKRMTEITIDTHETVTAYGQPPSVRAWCRECEIQSVMLPLDVAAQMAGVDLRTMNGWIQARRVHLGSNGSTGPLICWVSLAREVSL